LLYDPRRELDIVDGGVKERHLLADLDQRRLVAQRANLRCRDHFDFPLLLERINGGGGIEILKDQRAGVSPGSCRSCSSNGSNPVYPAQGRVLKLPAAGRDRQRRSAEGQRAAVGLRDVDPIDTELELITERHVVKFSLDLN